MDLSKLDKSEAIAARVYLRRRRKVWDHFYDLQELKAGDFISTKHSPAREIKAVIEGVDAYPFDIKIICKNKTYVFGIGLAEAGLMDKFLKVSNSEYKDTLANEVKINPVGKVLFGHSQD